MYSEQLLLETLQKTFGFEQFRPKQLAAIKCLLDQNNALCIHPTGFGKSLLYQLPAILLEGMTIVISPLLALMRDQEKHLNIRFKIPAASINSDQSDEENHATRLSLQQGKIKILFVAPEQLGNIDRFNDLLDLPIDLVVVDEAHCISTWGHDFRPSYRCIIHFIKALREKKNHIKVLGLTATADMRTERDIREQLSDSSHSIEVLRESMDRPNIQLSVVKTQSIVKKLMICEQLVRQLEGVGLIYCATRENTELVAKYLIRNGINASAYHAGFAPEEKCKLQQDFLDDNFKVLAATNALGMGIDKSNLRFIIHFDVPGSITAYYQEIGRCGRDGLKSHAILIFDPDDKKIQKHFIESAQPTEDDFKKVLAAVQDVPEHPNLMMIKRLTGLHPTRVTVVLAELVEQGLLTKRCVKGVQVYAKTDLSVQLDLSRYTTQYVVKMRELENMLQYAEQQISCRMAVLRKSLGDQLTTICNHCCVCSMHSFSLIEEGGEASKTLSWLTSQGVEIVSSKVNTISEGLALLDGRWRSTLFVDFMRQRAAPLSDSLGLPDELIELLKNHLSYLTSKHPIVGIIPIPSKTWLAREQVASFLGSYLDVPVFSELLSWKSFPKNRQGELLNNDQRHYNVHQQMTGGTNPRISQGAFILFDDYIGSGNTLKEAARALRKDVQLTHDIIPFTIASVKWKLGSSGMI